MELEFLISDLILQFTVLATVILVIQFTFTRLHIPGLVGLLVIGMLIGPGGFAVLPREPVVELLGSVGLLFIMFLAGLEVDLAVVKTHKQEAITFGLLAFALSLVPAMGVGLLMGYGWAGAVLLGAALSSHTLLAYPIIERLRLFHHRPIVATIGGTLLTDTLALVLLVVVTQRTDSQGGTLSWLGPLFLLAALVGVSFATIPHLGRYFFENVQGRPAEKALFLLVILLLLSVAADVIGTEDILGAFIAGVCLNRLVQRREELQEHLQFTGRMLFIPFFFVETGMRLELAVFTGQLDTWVLAGFLLIAVLFGKSTASWITGAIFGYAKVARVVMSGLALPQAAATLAVVVTAREVGLLGEEVVDAIIIVIFLTCLLGPLVTRFAGRRLAQRRQDDQ